MAHIVKDRVREATTTTGTADFALAGAVTDFHGFSDVMANGDTCWYAAVLAGGGGWETGLATFSSPSTLQRTTVIDSSTGAKVSFGAGTKDLFMTVVGPAFLTAAGGALTGALNWAAAATVASAATADIGAAASNVVNISGTATITGLGTIAAGAMRWVKFAGALTLTHNATSLINLGGANIVTAAGDVALFVSEGSGNWRMLDYRRAAEVPNVKSDVTRTLNAQTGTTYTLAIGDAGNIVTMNNAAANTLTIPPNSSVAFPVGTQIDIAQKGAGKTTIAAGAGVTINNTNKSLAAQYAGVTAIKEATDTWTLYGSTIA
jgi:hypothetical protein